MPERLTRRAVRGRPLRVRLTAAFASVVAVVLAATGIAVFVEFQRDLDHRTVDELTDRQSTVVGLAAGGGAPAGVIALSGEAYAQIYDAAGKPLASSRALHGTRLLSLADVAQAKRATITVDRHPPAGDDDGARVRAFPIPGGRVAAVAEPLEDREQELRRLAMLLAITLPAALVLASVAGYQVARGALQPVEQMRSRAATIGAGDLSQRLPEPGTNDELDRLAITLNDLLDRLADAVERERRIVGDASHELRTPISVLRTRLDVALRGEQDPAALRAALIAAGADAARLSRLADDLLVLARADQGQLPLRHEPLDVQDLLEAAVARNRPLHPQVTLQLGSLIDGGAVVLGDPDRLAQVLDNLIANAARHGASPIELSAVEDTQGAVALRVRDHGHGFSEAFLPRAFDRFSQGEGDVSGGSGLGLAIVDAIARAHDGSATAENAPDGGAVVTLRLPAA